jgi:hypothetical protein
MNREDAIERLCKLVTEVGEKIFLSQNPHDCFCESAFHKSVGKPVIDEKIIRFIEDATRTFLGS